MAAQGIKYDDESGGFASNCFPVRFSRRLDNGGGAWVVNHQAEQRRRFKAVLCANPLTYDQIKDHRKRSDKATGPQSQTLFIPPPSLDDDLLEEDEDKILDGFFLMKHCCVEDPADLCSVNVSGQGLVDIKEEDLVLFDNVAYVNASDNLLPLEPMRSFPILRELEISVNALRSIQINPGDFQHLEMLDVSFNNLSQADILSIGLLPSLKILHLTGNGLTKLPDNLAYPFQTENSDEKMPRYRQLEILLLEDNRLADLNFFAALAGLPNLRHLSLAKNEIIGVPQLLVLDGRHITQDISTTDGFRSPKKSARSARHTSRSGHYTSRSYQKSEKSSRHSQKATSVSTPNNSLLTGVEGFSAKILENGQIMPSSDDTEIQDSTNQPESNNLSIDMEEINRRIYAELEQEAAMSYQEPPEKPTNLPPPFSELVHLDLSYNKISQEESLLALAAWPMLAELIIHNNPLTTETTGDPPLLKTYLSQRLGINIVRKKPGPLPKPAPEVKTIPQNQVSSVVPKVPKRDVEDVVRAIRAAIEPVLSPSPIPESPKTAQDANQETSITVEAQQKAMPKETMNQDGLTSEGDAFFMTQVEDQKEEQEIEETGAISKKVSETQKRNKKTSKTKHKREKRYEALYEDSDEESDKTTQILDVPTDVNGKVRALQQMLNHPLQYKDNIATLDKPQADFHPLYKKPTPPQKPRVTKQDQVRRVLTNLKERPTVKEANLDEILQSKEPVSKKDFPEAARLLKEVQTKYNAVRTASMKEARQVRDISQEITEQAQRLTAVL